MLSYKEQTKIEELADKLNCDYEQVEALYTYLKANDIDISRVDISVDNNTFNVGGCYIEVIPEDELIDKVHNELHNNIFTHFDMDFIMNFIDKLQEDDLFTEFCGERFTEMEEFDGKDVFIDGNDLTFAIMKQFEGMSAEELTKHLNDNDIEIDPDVLKEEGLMPIAVYYYTEHPALCPNAELLIDDMKLVEFSDKVWQEEKRDYIENVIDKAEYPTNYLDLEKMAKHIVENTPRDCANDLCLNDYQDKAFEYNGYFIACDRNIKEMKINKPSLNDIIKNATSKAENNKVEHSTPNKEKNR